MRFIRIFLIICMWFYVTMPVMTFARGNIDTYKQEAIEWIEKAIRLDPFHPDVLYEILATSLYSLGRYEEAAATFGRVRKPPAWVHRGLVSAYAQLGRLDDARRAFAALEETIEQQRREGDPDASVEWILSQAGHYSKYQEDREHWIDGLRKAGLDV